jgi:hypothetical protein
MDGKLHFVHDVLYYIVIVTWTLESKTPVAVWVLSQKQKKRRAADQPLKKSSKKWSSSLGRFFKIWL